MVDLHDKILTSKQEVADELGMSIATLARHLADYPFHHCGVTGQVKGRWRVPRRYVLVWWDYVLRQQSRHPDARRLRPEEAPGLREIKGR